MSKRKVSLITMVLSLIAATTVMAGNDAMKSSLKRFFILPFVVILGLLFFSASGGSGGPQAQGKGYPTVTFYVA